MRKYKYLENRARKDIEQIESVFKGFILAMESNDADILRSVLLPNAEANFSNLGHFSERARRFSNSESLIRQEFFSQEFS